MDLATGSQFRAPGRVFVFFLFFGLSPCVISDLFFTAVRSAMSAGP